MTKVSQSRRLPKIVPKRNPVDLREIHADGKRILEQLKKQGGGKTRNALIESLVVEDGINAAELWKRVRFAEKYDENGLQKLLKLDKLTWAHVRKLLTVTNAKERARFAKKANKDEWSPRRMTCEIEARLGTTHQGGRNPAALPITPGTLYALDREIFRMLGWFAKFDLDGTASPLKVVEPGLCTEQLEAVVVKLQELETAIPAFRERLEMALQSPQNPDTSTS